MERSITLTRFLPRGISGLSAATSNDIQELSLDQLCIAAGSERWDHPLLYVFHSMVPLTTWLVQDFSQDLRFRLVQR
jgi:hypothetical protein